VHIADVHLDPDSLVQFERLTRRLEAIHEVVFLGFVAFSIRRELLRRRGILHLAFEIAVYVLLILSPAMLQRYNRLRVYPLIRRMTRGGRPR
jgi:Glycosyl-4,4'-diaponeurosporenoate acyltransferase